MTNRVIAVVGAPGTGKSFLSQKLASVLNATYVVEPPLTDTVKKHLAAGTNALETQLYFLEKGIENIHKAILAKDSDTVVMDSYWMSTVQYLDATLSTSEASTVKSLISHMTDYLPTPDIVIWLTATDEHIVEQVKSRSRSFEISDTYIDIIMQMQKAHVEHFSGAAQIIVDKCNVDFSSKEALDDLLNQIAEEPMLTE